MKKSETTPERAVFKAFTDMCFAVDPVSSLPCEKPKGHDGAHVHVGPFPMGRIETHWPNAARPTPGGTLNG